MTSLARLRHELLAVSALSLCVPLWLLLPLSATLARETPENDVIKTSAGNLYVSCVGHGSLMFEFSGKVIHIDPWTKLGDYSRLPKADLILVTHEHPDHLDAGAIQILRKEDTTVIANAAAGARISGSVVMTNGASMTCLGIQIEAVPAYNIANRNDKGSPWHARGNGNGYVLTFGDKRIYVAGDTENTPELKSISNIECAFLPMNLPYTMTAEMVVDAAKAIRPKILYPYHTAGADATVLIQMLKGMEMDIRVRK
ncbi:MAG: MBL fold metallo-hydrolase [bacterium]